MKLLLKVIAVYVLSCTCLYGQTDEKVLKDFKSIETWQTPKDQVDSILNSQFTGGKEKFLEIVSKNIKFESRHQDHWVQNYLIELKVSRGKLLWRFKNNPLKVDRDCVEKAMRETESNWKNTSAVNMNILISSDVDRKFNANITKAYVQVNSNKMVALSDCDIEDKCRFDSKEELEMRVKDLQRIGEVGAAVYYQKVLVRRFPFDQEMNATLRNMMTKLEM